ncbi:MAG: 2,3-bisphosphoglycerate-independent phosphoglycerate mutase [Thermoplasmata archaeon]|nr:2,3-bisphosphoglycerate-independent phosphoglycerate mutase [Thermoplasmata archaeon]
MRKSVILLILDGAGDRPVGGRTPLEVAETPNLDAIASRGECGMLSSVGRGIRPGSDTAHLALLGVDPFEYYTGRGPFEALGLGMELEPGDVAFRLNFGTVDRELRVLDRRAGRIPDARPLAEALDGMVIDGIEFRVAAGVEHRGALVMRGKGLGWRVTDVDPHETGVPLRRPKGEGTEDERTARALWKFVLRAHEVLREHPLNREREEKGLPPANAVLPRGAGIMAEIPSPLGSRGLRGAIIAGIPLVKGVGRALGLEVIEVPGATGGKSSNFRGKVEAAVRTAEDREFILVNIKAPDVFSHDGDFEGKTRVLEAIDRCLEPLLSFEGIVAVTADHSTPVSVRDHTSDPTPVAVAYPGGRMDHVREYSETACYRGSLGHLNGNELFRTLLDYAGLLEKFGA